MPQRRLIGGRRLVLCAFVLLAALPSVAMAQAGPPAGWQRPDLRPMTQPAFAGGLFAMYARAAGGLQVIAVDPASGRTVWSLPASPSEVTQGQAPVLMVAGPEVVFLGRDAGTRARLTAVDAATGAILWRSAVASFTTWPGLCGDDATAICVSSESRTGTSGAERRFDLATGRALPSARIPGDGVRELGVELIDPGARIPAERLVAVTGSRVRWNHPVDRIFAHPVTSDVGWDFGRYGDLGMYVGSLGADADEVRAGSLITHLANNETVGFRIATGRVAWRAHGFYACFVLPCPGLVESGGFASTAPNVPAASIGVRLAERGTTREGIADDSFSFSSDAGVTIEGFTPASGHARWRFDAGRDIALLEFSAPPRTGLSSIVVPDTHRRLRELDVATGARRRARSATPAWCRRSTTFRAPTSDGLGDVRTDDFVGQPAVVPCRAGDERRLPTPAAAPAFVGQIAATAAGLVAWADTTGLFARPVAP
jgi:hypothetical protein